MKVLVILLLAGFINITASNVFAYAEDEDYNNYESYDSIVGDLSNRTSGDVEELIDLDSMKLHAGFGFNNTLINLAPKGNYPDKVTLEGFQLSLGIDLFSPNVVTEVSLINYNSVAKESYKFALKEFDLKTYYRHHLNRIVAIRGGIGLGVRYFDIQSDTQGSEEYTNPVSQILVGGEAKLGNRLSFVSELSYKNSLTGGAPEDSALDLTFRVDGHF